jgi:hypothetical protein
VRGTPNKRTKTALEAFQFAFDTIGGAADLADWARTNRDEFYRLYARLIPVQHTGPNAGPIATTVKFIFE